MSGLSLNECLDLTLAQIKGIMKGISKNEHKAQIAQANAIRVAVWGDDKDWRRYVSDSTQQTINPKDLNASKEDLEAWGITT